jgi:hypothetical protein
MSEELFWLCIGLLYPDLIPLKNGRKRTWENRINVLFVQAGQTGKTGCSTAGASDS